MFGRLAALIGVPPGVLGFILLLLGTGGIFLGVHLYDQHVIAQEDTRRIAAAAPAYDAAASQRATDTLANAANEKDLHDAIKTAPTGGTLSPAAHALACERLRKAGRTLSASCRPAGGNGVQAPAP